MSILDKYFKMVETAIERLGVDVKNTRTDEPNKWFLRRGDAEIVMFVRESQLHTENKKWTLVILSPIISLPKNPIQAQKLRDKLLETNHIFISERFSIADEIVYLAATTFMDSTNEANIATLLDSLSYYAQGFVSQFALEYGKND